MTASPTPTKSAGKAADTTRNLNTAKELTGTNTEEDDSTETGTGKSNKTKSKGDDDDEHTTFAPNDPAGGVSMTEPATTLMATPLFKIGDYVTLGWNYTSLQGTPSAIDVLVSCSSAAQTWTLTSNMTFETAVSYVWDTADTAKDAEKPLGVDLYTLIIKDSDAEITERAEPGYLGAYSGFKFGLYTPRPYTPLPDWECVGCSRGTNNIDHHAIGFALSMCLVTIFSFTWFVTGLGLH